jgi:hypothetical protein
VDFWTFRWLAASCLEDMVLRIGPMVSVPMDNGGPTSSEIYTPLSGANKKIIAKNPNGDFDCHGISRFQNVES